MRSIYLPSALLLAAACSAIPPEALPPERQVLIVLADDGAGPPLPSGSRRGYRHDQGWHVSLHTRAHASRVARDHHLRAVHAWSIRPLEVFCVVLQVPDGASVDRTVANLATDPRVRHAQPVHVFRGMISRTYDDPLFELQYGRNTSALASLHALTIGQGVRVAIVDGQVDAAHPDLKGQIARQRPPPIPAETRALRHGTAVAGVVAAAAGNGEGLVGLAPGADVTVYAACRQVDGPVTRCTTVSLAEAIEQAIADRADVINLSIAGPEDWVLERLLHHAHERGSVVVGADGDRDGEHGFPASLPYVHAAGTGSAPWFAGPERFSTRAGGGYQVFFGSSMSAAGISGAAALLRSRYSGSDTQTILRGLLELDCTRPAKGPLLEALQGHDRCSR